MVYTSLNVATCVLETLVHFGPQLRAKLPDNLVLVRIEIPDDVATLKMTAEEIPPDADAIGTDGRTWYQRTGDAWLEHGAELVLLAPSAVVRYELNAMLNPAHPRMVDVRIVSPEPFRFDPRLALPRVRDRRFG